MHKRLLLAAVVGGVVGLGVTGCAPTVSLHPAPEATSIRCAQLIAGLREQALAGLVYRHTDAQGTLAWGQPLQVTVVCGETDVPASSRCVTVGSVDWTQVTLSSKTGSFDRFDTFGRTPDIAVVMTNLTVSPATVLEQLSGSVTQAVPSKRQRCG